MSCLFTVIIPHYNSWDFLETCLKSIPTNKDIQVIVVDDCTPNKDKYWESIKQAYPEVIFLELSRNKGAGAARNMGLKYALGRWIIFADADDYFVNNAFDIFLTHANDTADIVFFKEDSIDITTGKQSYRHLPRNNYIDSYNKTNIKSEKILRYKTYGPVCKMIKHEFLTLHNILFEEEKYSNDVMFSVKIGYYANTIEVDKHIVYCITTTQGSLTADISNEAILCRYKVAIRLNKFMKAIDEPHYQVLILKFFVLAIKHHPSLVFQMIKVGLQHRVNIFSGFRQLYHILDKSRRDLTRC